MTYTGPAHAPQDKALLSKYKFFKANIEDESLAAWVKEHNVRGIPYMAVFSPEGKHIIGFSASFKKMQVGLECVCIMCVCVCVKWVEWVEWCA